MHGLYAFDDSHVNISGGAVAGVEANGSSLINISGGTIAADGVNALDCSTVNVTGALDGLDALSGAINFADSSVDGTLITQPVPEAPTAAGLVLGTLCLATLAFRPQLRAT